MASAKGGGVLLAVRRWDVTSEMRASRNRSTSVRSKGRKGVAVVGVQAVVPVVQFVRHAIEARRAQTRHAAQCRARERGGRPKKDHVQARNWRHLCSRAQRGGKQWPISLQAMAVNNGVASIALQ